MTVSTPPDPNDPDEWLSRDRFVAWDWKSSRYIDPVDLMMQSARDALTSLGMIRGFARCDLALIAETAQKDEDWSRAMELKLEKDTGIPFHLTPRQWGVLASELSDDEGV